MLDHASCGWGSGRAPTRLPLAGGRGAPSPSSSWANGLGPPHPHFFAPGSTARAHSLHTAPQSAAGRSPRRPLGRCEPPLMRGKAGLDVLCCASSILIFLLVINRHTGHTGIVACGIIQLVEQSGLSLALGRRHLRLRRMEPPLLPLSPRLQALALARAAAGHIRT